jgi:arylsulfatase A-like enzyme
VTRKSVVLITVDCLRADHCGFMGCASLTTPFLDALSRESFVFPMAIAAGVPTYYSLPAIVASRYPLALGREVVGLAPEEKNLASVFKQNGYATAFFGAGNPYLSSRFGYDFGFDAFDDFLNDDFPNDAYDPSALSNAGNSSSKRAGWAGSVNRMLESASHKIPGLGKAYDELYFQYCQRWAAREAESVDKLRRFPAADVLVDHGRAWLKSVEDSPFFLWLHFMDPHSPYYPSEEGWKIFTGQPLDVSRARYLNASWNRGDLGRKRLRPYRREIVQLYDSGIRWVDAQISRLVELLRDLKLWEDCIFAVTADHGEEFLEHDLRYHAPGLAEELIHVPLIVRVPGMRKKNLSANLFSLLHLAPTLLEAGELPVPHEFEGRSHWGDIQGGTAWNGVAISECIEGCTNPFRPQQRRGSRLLAVREPRYKLLLNFDTGTDYLFDLDSDPGERKPVPSSVARLDRRRLLEVALAHLRKLSARQPSELYLRSRLRDIAQGFGTSTDAALRAAG